MAGRKNSLAPLLDNSQCLENGQLFLTCQDVRFYSHVICPLYITKSDFGGQGAKPPIQEHSSLPA